MRERGQDQQKRFEEQRGNLRQDTDKFQERQEQQIRERIHQDQGSGQQIRERSEQQIRERTDASGMVALLFRTLDAFRIFDTVYVQTRGAGNTETVSLVGYNVLIARLNLGLGSAVSVLIFIGVLIIALLFLKGFGTPLTRQQGE